MKISMPKEFFESLSKKTQEEIKEKANKFSHTYYEKSYTRDYHPGQQRWYIIPKDRTNSVLLYEKPYIELELYTEKSNSELKRLFELEKKEQELDVLKNSLANLKSTIGEL